MLSRAIGAVPGGCEWCVTITIMAGAGCSVLMMAVCVHRFESCGRLVLEHVGWQSGSLQCQFSSLEGVFEGFVHKLVKELSFMAIGTYNMLAQLMLLVFIIYHLTVVHQCFDVCDKVLRVLSRPGYNVLKFPLVAHGC